MRRIYLLMASVGLAFALLFTAARAAIQIPPPTRKLVLVARDGTRTVVGDLPSDTFSPRISTDGRQLSFESRGSAWIADMSDLASRRQFKPLPNVTFPVWRDAGRLLFIFTQGQPSLYSADLDGPGSADRLVDVARAPDGWSAAADGASFITLNGSDYDIWFYSAKTRQVTPIVVIAGTRQLSSQISPDGKWIAYKSDETGSFEIWVQPFPTGTRTRVTTTGGRNPRWSPDSRTLFFDDDQRILMTRMTSEAPLAFDRPQPLPVKDFVQAGSLRRQWDLMPDNRFLIMTR